ncbi:MAG TPA: prepilin peptidase, partial [Chloroflexota bacterium]|nr:prepilin peptidase [Chloroflexota bacterium]
LGLVGNTAIDGWSGFTHSAAGWAVGLGLMLLPFMLRAMGAGDVKLMAAIGAVKGPEFVLVAALYTCLAGGMLAAFYLFRERRLLGTVQYIAYGWFWALRGSKPKAGAIPYAPAIAAGAILALVPYSLLASVAPSIVV